MAQGTTKGVPIDVDPLLDLDSDLVVPSQKAIKAYVDAKKSAADSDYVNVSGDTMTGYLLLHADPTINLHAATKQYVDNFTGGVTDGDKGDITVSTTTTPGDTWTIDNDAITTAKIANAQVTVDKISATGTPSASTFLAGNGTWATGTASGTIASGTARRLAIYTGTTALDDTAPTDGSVITLASQASARTYTIPDAGTSASFVMTASSQTIAGTKTFSGTAGPITFSNIVSISAPAVGATPSNGTRIVIAPGDATNVPLSFGWNTNYEFWMAGRWSLNFYPRNQTTSVGAFDYVTSSGGTTGLILSSTFNSTVPALRSTGWLFASGANSGAVPTVTTSRSTGTKIVLRDSFVASTTLDAAIGTVEELGGASFSTLWFTAPRDITFYTRSSTTEKLRIGDTSITLGDGINFAFNTTTGTQIGTSTTQKLGFHAASPTIQRASASQAAVVTTTPTLTAYGYTLAQATAIITLLNEMRAALVEKGLIKGSA